MLVLNRPDYRSRCGVPRFPSIFPGSIKQQAFEGNYLFWTTKWAKGRVADEHFEMIWLVGFCLSEALCPNIALAENSHKLGILAKFGESWT